MIDIVSELNAIHRAVDKAAAADGDVVRVVLRRSYPAAVDDVWSAITEPDRLRRWFLPISGDLQVGGHFQLEGNAGGEILDCRPPELLRTTFGDASSIVVVRLSAAGEDHTDLELEHTVPLAMAGSAAGALWVGPGWDGALMGLGLFVRGEAVGDPVAAANSPEVLEFNRHSVGAWVAAAEASGEATTEQIAEAKDVAMAQFTEVPS